ncbi:MAG: SGNH/GDSL hydrolase family protein [Armatimonadetes bacterium]|nr:SGNH/GDSL hydrolase family protein [Armatimonadota bacterium]
MAVTAKNLAASGDGMRFGKFNTARSIGLIFILLISAQCNEAKTVSILFIGNSLTYVNNMPAILKTIAKGKVNVETGLVAKGLATLANHWQTGKALEMLKSRKWDWVVLQDQSSFGQAFLYEGIQRVDLYDELWTNAKLFADEAKRNGSKVALLGTWRMQDSDAREQAALDYGYAKAAKDLGCLFIPVGDTWQAEEDAGLKDLYMNDRHHPSPLGSYVAALCVARTLLGIPLKDLPREAKGEVMEFMDGSPSGREETLVSLDQDVAAKAQQVAERFLSQPASLDSYKKPNPVAIKPLPKGLPIEVPKLVGTWVGSIQLGPAFLGPSTMRLELHPKDKGLAGKITVTPTAPPNSPSDVELSITSLDIQADSCSFKDPQGPNGAVGTYRIVMTKSGLEGMVEYKTPDQYTRLVASFRLNKV